jgi:CRISPR-associated endonuclease/helicase Cas3
MTTEFIAHTSEDGCCQLLSDHLSNTAKLAAEMAKEFGCSEWGYLAGLWHDLGKYQGAFQERIRGVKSAVEHSGAGAAHAHACFGAKGLPLAFVIAGHHAGLANLRVGEAEQPTPLMERLKTNNQSLTAILTSIPPEIRRVEEPKLPQSLTVTASLEPAEMAKLRRASEFWTRFLFSSLVDADRLDTEAFSTPKMSGLRSRFASLAELSARLDDGIEVRMAKLSPEESGTRVNQVRREVLDACRKAAENPGGIFSLTVPTGGGKTLSAMSFALRHALRNELTRVIVIIPYTSIIEQNAAVYKEALRSENVIEHHSVYRPQGQDNEATTRHELAVENWDAPVIVTTSVQFFETLFSNHPSVCRKLHNIARSVIILDEVQTLPPGLLLPIVEAIEDLTKRYGCSVVLSTATPPALKARHSFPQGLGNVHHIISDPGGLARDLKRVEYVWPDPKAAGVVWRDLAGELSQHHQVLAIVHRRQDARILAHDLKNLSSPESVFHLSALMCPVHRLAVIRHIKRRLDERLLCRVVSTQLVEAGVDLDFPVVYRALGGLSSIVQAAGRCNREGRLKIGKVVVFRAPTSPPPGTPRKAMEVTEAMLSDAGALDTDDPAVIESFFRRLYSSEDLDAQHIQTDRQELNFANVGQRFKLIEDGFTTSVVVPYENSPAVLEDLRHNGPSRPLLRALQPYTVSIYPKAFQILQNNGALEEVTDGIFAIVAGHERLYNDTYGLVDGDENDKAMPFLIG